MNLLETSDINGKPVRINMDFVQAVFPFKVTETQTFKDCVRVTIGGGAIDLPLTMEQFDKLLKGRKNASK